MTTKETDCGSLSRLMKRDTVTTGLPREHRAEPIFTDLEHMVDRAENILDQAK